jgi:peptidoglycan/LPS O-acetylase OafA/YrhL
MKATFSRSKSGYIPSLDGWRAVAIIGVMFFHGGAIFSPASPLESLRLMGEDGVRLFFAISGILICTRLLDEEEAQGSVSLKNFYIRRVFRIQPAAIVFLLTLVLLGVLRAVPFFSAGWWTSLLSTRNFIAAQSATNGAWYTAHFWSLAIEEQFYLVLPFLLILLRFRNRIRWFAAIAVVTIGCYEYLNRPSARHALRSESEMCWLFLAALLALLMRRPGFRKQCVKYLQPVPVLLLVCALLCGLVFHVRHLQHFWLPAFPFLIFATILHPESIVCRFLELSLMRWIGRISYSIYLWQQLFCVDRPSASPVAQPLAWMQLHPQNYLFPFAIALLSYLYVERPFIRLGHRFARPPSAGHADLDVENIHASA